MFAITMWHIFGTLLLKLLPITCKYTFCFLGGLVTLDRINQKEKKKTMQLWMIMCNLPHKSFFSNSSIIMMSKITFLRWSELDNTIILLWQN